MGVGIAMLGFLGGLYKSCDWILLQVGVGGAGRGMGQEGKGLPGPRGVNSSRPWPSQAATLQPGHSNSNGFSRSQGCFLMGKTAGGRGKQLAWPQPPEDGAEPPRTAPHLGAWERQAWPRGSPLEWVWVLGGTRG